MSERKFLILVEKPRSSPQTEFYKVYVSESELQKFWEWWRGIKGERKREK